MIRTWIVGVEGNNNDQLTTSMQRGTSLYFAWIEFRVSIRSPFHRSNDFLIKFRNKTNSNSGIQWKVASS